MQKENNAIILDFSSFLKTDHVKKISQLLKQ